MYGCFLVPPDDDGADLGCCSGTRMATPRPVGTARSPSGPGRSRPGGSPPTPTARSTSIDVPSGRVVASVRCRAGAVEAVAFRNVPSFVAQGRAGGRHRGRDRGGHRAWRGAGRVRVRPQRPRCARRSIPELIRVGRGIKRALEGHELARHPSDDRLGIYGTVVHEEVGPRHFRNVAIFADGEVDRSPPGRRRRRGLRCCSTTGSSPRGTRGATTRSSGRRSTPGPSAWLMRACSPRSRNGLPNRRAPVRVRGPRPARHRLRPAMTPPPNMARADRPRPNAKRLGPGAGRTVVGGRCGSTYGRPRWLQYGS